MTRRVAHALALFAAASLLAEAARLGNRLPGAEKVNTLFKAAGGLVCGGPEIKTLVGTDHSAERVRNIPWSKITSIASNFISSQQRKIDVLEVELSGLQEALQKALASEKPRDLSEDEIKAAVEKTAAASYGSLAIAKGTKCGGVRPKDKSQQAPAGAYEKAEEDFRAQMQSVLGAGLIRAEGGRLLEVCQSTLGYEEGDDMSFCSELCQTFADAAQQISDETVGGLASPGTSKELQEKTEAKATELKAAKAALNDCAAAKADLAGFQEELQGLSETIKVEFSKVRDARSALVEAQAELEDLNEGLDASSKSLKSLEDSVKGTGDRLNLAKDLLADVQAQNAAILQAVAGAGAQLQLASSQVKRAADASQVTQELRAQLSALLLKMSLYFDAAVRKPIRDLGLDDSVEVAAYFPVDPHQLPEAKDTETALAGLEGLCAQGETKKVFEDVKSLGVNNAARLCDLGGTSKDIEAEIDFAVRFRSTRVQQQLQKVQTWLDPLKGQEGITKQQVDGWVELGEPQGLRAIIAMMSNTDFYRHYLKHWTFKESFVKLLKRLSNALAEAQAQQAEVQGALAELQKQLQAGLQKQAQATEALKSALEANQVEAASKSLAETEYNSLKTQQQDMEDRLARLKAAFATAEAKYEAAKKAIEETHRQGTALVQLLGKVLAAHRAAEWEK